MTRAAAGPEEFGEWVRPHLPAMSRYAARLVGPDARDDVVQESLARAWQRWATYDPERGTPVGWLLAIVHDKARRHRARHRPWVGTDGGIETAAPEAGVDVDLERAIARLPRRERQAVELHYYVGLPVADAARVMGCAEGTVKTTLHAARARLRILLGDDS